MTEEKTAGPLNLPMPTDKKRGRIKDIKSGDRKERFGKINIVRYSPELALKICERIAKGEALKDICHETGMPSRPTFWKWIMLYEGLDKAYNAAREMSAQSLEEDALAIARKLEAPNKFSGTRVQAFKAAMEQYRWSAARRDPARYGSQADARIVVPVQINTTLDVKAGSSEGQGIYSIKATVPDAAAEDDPTNVPYATPEDPDRRMVKRPRRYNVNRKDDDGPEGQDFDSGAGETERGGAGGEAGEGEADS